MPLGRQRCLRKPTGSGRQYRLKIASVDGRDVTTSIGTSFAVTDRIASIESADTVLVAGGDGLVGRPIDPALVEALKTVPSQDPTTGVDLHRVVHLGSGRPAERSQGHDTLAPYAVACPRLPGCVGGT